MDLIDLNKPRADFLRSVVLLDLLDTPKGPELSLSLAASLLSTRWRFVSNDCRDDELGVGAVMVSER